MEISIASQATCSSDLPPVVSTLPFFDAPLSVDAPSTYVVVPAAVSAAVAAALGNGVTIPLTSAAGMMKLKVMGKALILNGKSNPSPNPTHVPHNPNHNPSTLL